MKSTVRFVCGLRIPYGQGSNMILHPPPSTAQPVGSLQILGNRLLSRLCPEDSSKPQHSPQALLSSETPPSDSSLKSFLPSRPRQWWFLSCLVWSFLAFSLLAQEPPHRSFLDLLPASHVCFPATGSLAESSRRHGLALSSLFV